MAKEKAEKEDLKHPLFEAPFPLNPGEQRAQHCSPPNPGKLKEQSAQMPNEPTAKAPGSNAHMNLFMAAEALEPGGTTRVVPLPPAASQGRRAEKNSDVPARCI